MTEKASPAKKPEEAAQKKWAKRAAIATFTLSAVLFVGSLILINAFDAVIAGAVVLGVSLTLWVLGVGFVLLAQP
jgi:hypothetical protein